MKPYPITTELWCDWCGYESNEAPGYRIGRTQIVRCPVCTNQSIYTLVGTFEEESHYVYQGVRINAPDDLEAVTDTYQDYPTVKPHAIRLGADLISIYEVKKDNTKSWVADLTLCGICVDAVKG